MKTLKIFSFIFCFLNAHFLCAKICGNSFGENSDSTKTAGSDFSFYNGFGIGYAERSGILCDHINFLKGNFVFGASARISTRQYWRDFYTDPASKYAEYKFVDEFALLGGYQIFNKESSNQTIVDGKLSAPTKTSTKLILNAGPIMRYERASYWPDKGSGEVPLRGSMLLRKKSDDQIVFGIMVSAEVCHFGSYKGRNAGLLVFSSYSKSGLTGGATINWLLGTAK